MQVNIIIFGQLTDITGRSSVTISDVENTKELVTELNRRYPLLADSKYVIAVDKEVVSENTVLTGNSSVALLPPFSGG
jgi:molybdopterin converting factor small subunit